MKCLSPDVHDSACKCCQARWHKQEQGLQQALTRKPFIQINLIQELQTSPEKVEALLKLMGEDFNYVILTNLIEGAVQESINQCIARCKDPQDIKTLQALIKTKT